jgi:hypothetical protein
VRINEELFERKVAAPVWKTEINDRKGSAALTTRHPSIHKSWHKTSSTSGGRSVGIVRLRTKGHGVCLFVTRLMASQEWLNSREFIRISSMKYRKILVAEGLLICKKRTPHR